MPFPVSEEDVRRTEVEVGRVFPLLYRAKMRRDNGGAVAIEGETWWLIPFRDSSSRKRIARTTNDILWETRETRAADVGFPDDAVAIAQNGAGDYLILLPHDKEADRFSRDARIWRLVGSDMSECVDVDDLFARESEDLR